MYDYKRIKIKWNGLESTSIFAFQRVDITMIRLSYNRIKDYFYRSNNVQTIIQKSISPNFNYVGNQKIIPIRSITTNNTNNFYKSPEYIKFIKQMNKNSIIKSGIIIFGRNITIESSTNDNKETSLTETTSKLLNYRPRYDRDGKVLPSLPLEKVEELLYERIKWQKENIYDSVNYELLKDFPVWLQGCKMANLAYLFEGKNWREIIRMNARDLEYLGVKSATFRRRLTTYFWVIRLDLIYTEKIKKASEVDVSGENM
ncbi:19857_t:CDS:2 [Gigaspora margarita]|uniref:19857_t:CDS:1 n=1 Tax=Gigaspora margarita TaxID=4874 RepID=A0ABM8W5W0_GIGMA|nr:19857_t:CDS:2 [Gigaspora margarita]